MDKSNHDLIEAVASATAVALIRTAIREGFNLRPGIAVEDIETLQDQIADWIEKHLEEKA